MSRRLSDRRIDVCLERERKEDDDATEIIEEGKIREKRDEQGKLIGSFQEHNKMLLVTAERRFNCKSFVKLYKNVFLLAITSKVYGINFSKNQNFEAYSFLWKLK